MNEDIVMVIVGKMRAEIGTEGDGLSSYGWAIVEEWMREMYDIGMDDGACDCGGT